MKRISAGIAMLLLAVFPAQSVLAFCGFYVAKADTKLFNQASQVVLVRHEDKTVLTMANGPFWLERFFITSVRSFPQTQQSPNSIQEIKHENSLEGQFRI